MAEPTAGPSVAGRRARMTVAYDGGGYHGFAENAGVRTVMGELRAAVARVVRVDVPLTGAGRTDAGVHAWGQVVSGDLPVGTDLADLRHRLNRLLGPEISIRAVEWADRADFDARFSASWRQYRYHVDNHPDPNPFTRTTAWHVSAPLALWAMNAGCDALIGEHDFAAFCRRPKVAPGDQAPSLRRHVQRARWLAVDDEQRPGLLRFEIRANAFCHQMVRSVVGLLVRVGLGAVTPGEVRSILLAGDRAAASQIAPPHGLVLWEVGYPPS